MAQYLEAIRQIIEPIINQQHYRLYELNERSESGMLVIEILVDADLPITLDQIVLLTELISPALDQADVIPHAYTLDVGTAGAEKRIDVSALAHYLGHYVHLTLSETIDGQNAITGTLIEADQDKVQLSYFVKGRPKKTIVALTQISSSRLAVKI
ncbi:MAG: hypothetical protein WCX47_01525 [Bacilli bacterium]|jgi:ribosome maturation factor RimP|nr:hypothetical protein [Bacilli bacterium]MDD3388930.1 hypothetical protein [Bacilli bacterium]MDD4344616.1 hypothetical protein [Bacilli bacterium]MDD4520610.1 hypothetical protein [Bacilli bacterium]MDY0399302.1 hypothetical protein [Bacilli bacterium]